jgi:hypothetical protein
MQIWQLLQSFFTKKINAHVQFPIWKVQKFDPKLNYFYIFFYPLHTWIPEIHNGFQI